MINLAFVEETCRYLHTNLMINLASVEETYRYLQDFMINQRLQKKLIGIYIRFMVNLASVEENYRYLYTISINSVCIRRLQIYVYDREKDRDIKVLQMERLLESSSGC
eukprot:TRINITY_DN2821_c0_g1_i1.p6 TRINITY_DN2821_c0_g1~~TRINITY_DN2821_c0_g1_i1.p6  ORF type:complete len:108 (+),score=0.58 TRINITY_DN2821_c0_g1_i1:562-885(+)